MTAKRRKDRGWTIEQTGKRTHGHRKQCGDRGEKRSVRGLSGNGKLQ